MWLSVRCKVVDSSQSALEIQKILILNTIELNRDKSLDMVIKI
jgi:hypothetical protein